MKEINKKTSLIIVCLLIFMQIPAFFISHFSFNAPPYDDAPAYQIFVKDLTEGHLNFTQGSFQGASLPAVPIYLISKTPQAYSVTNFFFAITTIPLMYLLAKKLFQSELLGTIAALFYSLMPAIIFSPFSGYPQGVFHFLTISTALLVLNKSRWTFLVFGWSLITKPFSIALLPFFLYRRSVKHFLLGCTIGIVYLGLVLITTGKIQMGVHQNITPINVFHPERFLYNLASTPPLILSIHNFLPLSKSTSLADMMHISPLVIVFSFITLTKFKIYYPKFSLFFLLFSFYLLGLLIPLTLSYTDTNYLQTFYLGAILIILPYLKKNPLLIPLTVATTGYQFFYFYLRYQEFWTFNGFFLFLIEIIGLVISIIITQASIRKYITQLYLNIR